MNVAALRMMLDYHYWANRRVWACVMKLNDEQFARDLDYSVGSIYRHVVHMMIVEWLWFSVATGTLPENRDEWLKPEQFTTRPAIRARWSVMESDAYAFLDHATDADTNRMIHYDFPWCGPQDHPAWALMMYMITHAVDHRAQVLQGIHRMGGETVAQDFVRYLWEGQKKS